MIKIDKDKEVSRDLSPKKERAQLQAAYRAVRGERAAKLRRWRRGEFKDGFDSPSNLKWAKKEMRRNRGIMRGEIDPNVE